MRGTHAWVICKISLIPLVASPFESQQEKPPALLKKSIENLKAVIPDSRNEPALSKSVRDARNDISSGPAGTYLQHYSPSRCHLPIGPEESIPRIAIFLN